MWGYIFGIALIALGFFLIWKTEWFIDNFGHSDWAEQHLGNGGTHNMYKIVGMLMIIGSLFGMTGLLGEIFVGIFGRLFGLS